MFHSNASPQVEIRLLRAQLDRERNWNEQLRGQLADCGRKLVESRAVSRSSVDQAYTAYAKNNSLERKVAQKDTEIATLNKKLSRETEKLTVVERALFALRGLLICRETADAVFTRIYLAALLIHQSLDVEALNDIFGPGVSINAAMVFQFFNYIDETSEAAKDYRAKFVVALNTMADVPQQVSFKLLSLFVQHPSCRFALEVLSDVKKHGNQKAGHDTTHAERRVPGTLECFDNLTVEASKKNLKTIPQELETVLEIMKSNDFADLILEEMKTSRTRSRKGPKYVRDSDSSLMSKLLTPRYYECKEWRHENRNSAGSMWSPGSKRPAPNGSPGRREYEHMETAFKITNKILSPPSFNPKKKGSSKKKYNTPTFEEQQKKKASQKKKAAGTAKEQLLKFVKFRTNDKSEANSAKRALFSSPAVQEDEEPMSSKPRKKGFKKFVMGALGAKRGGKHN